MGWLFKNIKAFKMYILMAFNIIFPLSQFVYILFDTNDTQIQIRNVSLFIIVSGIISIILGLWYGLDKKKKDNKLRNFSFNQTHVSIQYGDIFNEAGIILIPMDDSFEIDCKSNKIPNKSIQAIFTRKVTDYKCIDKLKQIVDQELSNLSVRKPLGARFDMDEKQYLIFPIVGLDENGTAKMELVDYVSMLINLCEAINIHAKKNEVIIPLVGSGVVITNQTINSFEKLRTLLTIIRIYNFNREIHIKIMLNGKNDSKYLLSEL